MPSYGPANTTSLFDTAGSLGGGSGGLLDSIFGGVGSGLGILGGLMPSMENQQTQSDINNMAAFNPQGATTGFGQTSFSGGQGQFQLSPQQQAIQALMGQGVGGLLQGGMAQNPDLQSALANNNITGALQQSDQALQQSSNPFMDLGAFQQNQGNVNNLAGMFAQNVAGGPQDMSGGMQQNLFSQGMANQLAAADQSQLFNNSLTTQRAAGATQQNDMFNKLQDRLFATGQLGSTGGGNQMEGLFNSFAQQDLGFQNNAFNQATQQQNFLANLGMGQTQQGAGLLGQNLGQFNQNVNSFQGLTGLSAGMEGQGFNQNLQSLQQNQSAGMNRLQQAQSMLGFGNNMFNNNFAMGLQGQGALQQQGQFGMDSILGLMNAENQRIGATGQHAEALASMQNNGGSGLGDIVSGIGGAIGLFSDIKLKDNVERIGTLGDLGWYQWDWNAKAKELGIKDESYGVLAHEVAAVRPELVTLDASGYLKVDYRGLV